MSKEEIFGLVLRAAGVIAFLYGLTYLLDALLLKLGYFHYGETTPGYFLIFGLGYCVFALYLARGAGSIVRFAYPPEEDEDEDEEYEEEQ